MPHAEHIQFRKKHFEPALRRATGQILELGCGKKPLAEHLIAATNIVLLDSASSDDFTRAKPYGVPFQIHVANAEQLPFENDSFDAIVAAFFLCSVRDVDKVVGEIGRVANRGARLILLEHVHSKNPLIRLTQTIVTPIHARLRRGCHLNRNPLGALNRACWTVRNCVTMDHAWPWLVVEADCCKD